MAASITVVKNDHRGQEILRYEGRVLERDTTHMVLEARFQRDDVDLGYVTLRHGDRFVEHFYTDRWYNVFAVYDVDGGHLKGFYCNVTRPALLGDGEVRADDLALDVFVFPDGRTLVMDEEEYADLPLSLDERQHALAAVTDLQRRARAAVPPFDALSPT